MMTKINYKKRKCECCESKNLEFLWKNLHRINTRSQSWLFEMNNVICRDCGFTFVSPAPFQESLNEYYADLHAYIAVDYIIENRINFIKKYIKDQQIFLEIGSNIKTKFHEKLESIFNKVYTYEINDSFKSDIEFENSKVDIKESIDVIGHYFVLEHVPDVKDFLILCYSLLKPGGIMICEVPDISYYPSKIAALVLHEHVNHFSIVILKSIAKSIGFSLLGCSNELCSRDFGFVAAFKKDGCINNGSTPPNEFVRNKNYFNKGKIKALKFKDSLDCAYEMIDTLNSQHKKVIVWAANNMCTMLFDGKIIPDNVTIVDSDPQKVNYINQHVVLTPENAKQHILNSAAIVICTSLYSAEILSFITERFSKKYKPRSITVIDF